MSMKISGIKNIMKPKNTMKNKNLILENALVIKEGKILDQEINKFQDRL